MLAILQNFVEKIKHSATNFDIKTLFNKSVISRFLKSDRAMLLFCIGIAFVFWLLNKLSLTFPCIEIVTISYQMPPQKAFLQEPPKEIRVSLKRNGWDLLWKKKGHITLEINEKDDKNITFAEGQLRQNIADIYGVRPDEVGLLGDEHLQLQLEERTEISVPIDVLTDIRFAKNFQMAAPMRINPAMVRVSGAKTLIQRLQRIKTDTLRFENVGEKMTGHVNIKPHPLLSFSQTQVEVTVFGEQFTEKTMYITVAINNAPAQMRIFPNKVRLSCVVGLSRYNVISANDFYVEVDLKNTSLNTTNNTLPISIVSIPDSVKNVKCSPNAVEFYFEK